MVTAGNMTRGNNGQQQQLNGGKSNGNTNINIASNMKKNHQKTVNNINNVVDISDDSPTERHSVNGNGHNPQQSNTTNRIQITQNTQEGMNGGLTGNSNLSCDPYDVGNLSVRQVCLCGKSCQMMQPKKDFIFKCCHCNLHYHIECMQRGKANIHQTDPIKKLVSCAYCHLK